MSRLHATGYLVLDEADHMLDMGFIHSLRKIAKHIPLKRQTLLFSATMPKDIEELAETYLQNPIKVQVAPPGKPVERIDQGVHYLPNGDKALMLKEYLLKHPGEQALVFGRTKHGSEKLMKLLGGMGLQGGLDPRQQKPEPARPHPDRIPQGGVGCAGGDRCGLARHRHSRRALCL